MSDTATQHEVEQFLYAYAAALDDERFAEWPAFFDAGDCTYRVLSRENTELDLPVPIMGAYSHGMVTDRVLMLVKNTLTWRHMYFRHQIANVRLAKLDDALGVKANFTVHQSDHEGVANLFMVGQYDGELVRRDGALKLRRLDAVVDSFGVDNMLAVPL